jgi:hypothetical protein
MHAKRFAEFALHGLGRNPDITPSGHAVAAV